MDPTIGLEVGIIMHPTPGMATLACHTSGGKVMVGGGS